MKYKIRLYEESNLNNNFWTWFGNSKVIDSEGKPRIVYHGTNSKFQSFNKKKAAMGGITWFSSNRDKIEAGDSGAAGRSVILELYAKIENPAGWNEYEKFGLGQLVARGYDGVILERKDGFDGFVFEPNQLKSIHNKGTWSLDSNKLKEQQLPLKKIKSFKTDEGVFSVWDIDDTHRNRGDMFTVFESKDGWIIRNALLPEELQKQGIGTQFYIDMNKLSLKKTGKSLRSTQERILSNRNIVHELSTAGIKLWDSLVKKGLAIKLGNKNYRFK